MPPRRQISGISHFGSALFLRPTAARNQAMGAPRLAFEFLAGVRGGALDARCESVRAAVALEW